MCVYPRNCDKYSENSSENGMFQGYNYQLSGHVSLSHPPTRHESGSSIQNYNYNFNYNGNNAKAGKLYLLYNFNLLSYFKAQIHDQFEHSFSSIRAKTAELEAYQNLSVGNDLLLFLSQKNVPSVRSQAKNLGSFAKAKAEYNNNFFLN
jgi:hypothetical protein